MVKECMQKEKGWLEMKKGVGDADPKSGAANVTANELFLIEHYSAYVATSGEPSW